MAELLRGKPVADAIVTDLRARIAALIERGTTPQLAIVRVGESESDCAYERAAVKRFEGLGMQVKRFILPEMCTQEQLHDAIYQVNTDSSIHGCLMLRPLPDHLDEDAACKALDTRKDVDGITPGSISGVFTFHNTGYPPCTPAACIELLRYYQVPLEGARVVVIGRSLVVGRPLALLLQAEDATVTMCHTRTRNLSEECRAADVLVVAAGHAGLVGAEAVAPGQTVIDVGINWDEEAQKLVGDVAFNDVEPIVDRITPVPGGVGSVTTAVLAKHLVQACEREV